MAQAQRNKRRLIDDACLDEETPSKRARAEPKRGPKYDEQGAKLSLVSVAHWAATAHWPQIFKDEGITSSEENYSERKKTSVPNSDRLDRLSQDGTFLRALTPMRKSSKDLCLSFLEGDRTPGQFPCYPPERIHTILERVQGLESNEGRVRRDITPWVVPSAENLHFGHKITPEYIGEEIQVEWTGCVTMGSTTRPKPDYIAGLSGKAFSQDEIEKIEKLTSFETLFFFTANLYFPFLMCEAKTGLEGMDKAGRLNMHSASIAVRAIIELYKAAFGTQYPHLVNELYGQVLAFSVSHDDRQANLYGHYAVLSDDSAGKLQFYRYEIDIFSFTMHGGAEKFKPYNFVVNIYEKFAPMHRQRIQDAVAFLQAPAELIVLSSTESGSVHQEIDSQQGTESQDDNRVLKVPTLPPTFAQIKEVARIQEEIAVILQQMQQEKQDSEMEMQRQARERVEEFTEQQRKFLVPDK